MSSPRPIISPRKPEARRQINGPGSATHKREMHRHSPSMKKRRLNGSHSSPPVNRNSTHEADEEEDMESLMRLYKMAQETMTYCEGRLRKLHHCGSVNKKRREALSDSNGGSSSSIFGVNRNFIDEKETIGGIPKKFLDLRYFPRLDSNKMFTKQKAAHVITDENAQFNGYQSGQFGALSPSIRSSGLGVRSNSPYGRHSRSNSPNLGRKLPQNTLSISSPLSHINGTYIQEGSYNNSPLFVRVGPPRKFMGFDCCVVLRREIGDAEKGAGNGKACEEITWKIGLVPSHTITHQRLIGYYEAAENQEGEPPVEGWKVPGSVKKVSGLRILYEE